MPHALPRPRAIIRTQIRAPRCCSSKSPMSPSCNQGRTPQDSPARSHCRKWKCKASCTHLHPDAGTWIQGHPGSRAEIELSKTGTRIKLTGRPLRAWPCLTACGAHQDAGGRTVRGLCRPQLPARETKQFADCFTKLLGRLKIQATKLCIIT